MPLVKFESKPEVCNAIHGKHNYLVISSPVGLAGHLNHPSSSLLEGTELENTALLP